MLTVLKRSPGGIRQMFLTGMLAAVVSGCSAGEGARVSVRTVTLKPGDNFIDTTVVITDAVRYVSASGAKSRIVGAHILKNSSFAKVADEAILARLPECARGKVYVCDFRSRIDAPSVFIGGKFGELARWPNVGNWAYIAKSEVVCRGVERTDKRCMFEGCSFILDDPRARRWDFRSGVRMKGYWTHDWSFSGAFSDSFGTVNGTNNVVTLTRPVAYGLMAESTSGGHAKRRYYVYDLLEELDAEGEYYYDRKEGKLYVFAADGIDGVGEIAVCDSKGPVFRVRGAAGVEFVGLDFAYRQNGFLQSSDVRDLLVDNCSFTCNGGIEPAILLTGAERCTIKNTRLTQLGGGGISLDGGDRPTLRRGDNLIQGCKVLRFGIIRRTGAPAIALFGVGNTVRGCELAYAPHLAVAPNCNYGVFEYNDVHDVLLETGDCGAFYTGRNWFMGQGQVIRFNHIHDLGKLGGASCAIYFDDCQCGGKVYGNVIENVARGMLIGGGRDHLVHDNIFRNCKNIGVSLDTRGLVWKQFVSGVFELDKKAMKAVRFTESPWKEAFPRMAHYLDVPDEKYAPLGNEIHSNLFIDCETDGKVISLSRDGARGEKMTLFIPRLRLENNYSASTGEKKAGGPDDRAPASVTVLKEKVSWPLAADSPVFEKLPKLVHLPLAKILSRPESAR